MRRFLAPAVAVAAGFLLLALFAGARPAAAHHEEYWVMEAANPYGGGFTHQVGNKVMREWWNRTGVTWNSNTTALPGQGDLDDHARAAITAWRALDGAQFANTVWTEVGLGTDADVEFRYTGYLCDPDPACMVAHATLFSTEDAYYLTAAEIWLTDDAIRSPNGLLSDVNHEIGHVYGLAENYRHDAASPLLGHTASVMNGGVAYISGLWGTGSTCPAPATACYQGGYYPPSPTTQAVLNPTAEDGQTLKAYWRGRPGWSGAYPFTRINGVTLAYGVHKYGGYAVAAIWQDYAWSERVVNVWYEEETAPGVWTAIGYSIVTDADVGRHLDHSPANTAFAIDGDLTAWGAGTYRICALPILQGASTSGGGEFGEVLSCSGGVAVP